MEEQQLLELIIGKFYGVIDEIAYDCETILKRLRDSGLINEQNLQSIENKTDAIDKNR